MKVLTLNLDGYGTKHGPWVERRGAIAGAIGRHDPDVVALQAVRKDATQVGGLDQASQLRELLPQLPACAFEPAMVLPDGSVEGLAFLARSAPEETGSRRLLLARDAEDSMRRLVFQASFQVPGGVLRVFNAQFSSIPAQNAANLAEASESLARWDGPAVLVGDFNCRPDAPGLARLRAGGWEDLWGRLRPGDEGFTFESDRPDQRIDYVWVRPELLGRAHSIELVMASGSEGVRLSDHHGLLAAIDL